MSSFFFTLVKTEGTKRERTKREREREREDGDARRDKKATRYAPRARVYVMM